MAWRNLDIDHLLTAELLTGGRTGGDEPRLLSGSGASKERVPAHEDVSGHTPEGDVSPHARANGLNPTSPRSKQPSTVEQMARLAAEQVVDLLRKVDRDARRAGRTIPTRGERDAVAASFWWMIRAFAEIDERAGEAERARCAAAVGEVLNPWLLRSSYWARSYLKPHGYAGDFRMLEWMYDLECDGCADPTQPAVVNLLDYLYSTVHSVRAVWHRRRWYAKRIHDVCANALTDEPVRILDLACGGSRYVRDAIPAGSGPGAVELTFLDQDPAALAFIDSWLPGNVRGSARLICGPVRDARRLVGEVRPEAPGDFDLIISTGLFDYLDDTAAKGLLADMAGLARPGGLVAVCNFAPADASRIVKDWVGDWPLIYRDTCALRELVPEGHAVALRPFSRRRTRVRPRLGSRPVAVLRSSVSAGQHVAR